MDMDTKAHCNKLIAENAKIIADAAHLGQFRKWCAPNISVPYIQHPAQVADKVSKLAGTNHIDVAAAWLHDVLEDVAIPKGKLFSFTSWISLMCGDEVLHLVEELTNPSCNAEWADKPRALKNEADFKHLAAVSDRAKRIKLVDRWANLQECQYAPKKWLGKYVKESRHLLSMIGYVDEEMEKELELAINEAESLLLRENT